MQQAELEAMRHREANQTALAAIGPRKKRKIEDMQVSFLVNWKNIFILGYVIIKFVFLLTGNCFMLCCFLTKKQKSQLQ